MNGLPDIRMALFGSVAKTDRMRQRCKREWELAPCSSAVT